MRIDFEYKPMEVHRTFHESTARERALFGAFGSGKTYAIIAEAIAWSLEQPGIRGLIARKTIPELRDTTEPIFQELMPPELWNAGELRRTGGHFESFTFTNGSKVMFRSIDDWNKQRSQNLGFLAFDELNEIDEESYDGMVSRVRQKDLTAEAKARGYTDQINRRGIWSATNPAGKDWIWRKFHPDSKDRERHSEMFISTTLDNPYLPLDYVDRLLRYPKPWVARYVLCQFDDFAGRIYEDWGEHCRVPSPFDGWSEQKLAKRVVWMGLDPGTRAPTAGLWVWLDDVTRRMVGIAEYEEPGIPAVEHVRRWRQLEAKNRIRTSWAVADPNSITQRDRGTGISLQEQYRQAGRPFSLGISAETPRITALGGLIAQGKFVVTENCPKTYEAILQYQWKDITPQQRASGEDPKEQALKRNTHLVECAQYLAGKQVPILKPGKPKPKTDFDSQVHATIKRQLARRGEVELPTGVVI